MLPMVVVITLPQRRSCAQRRIRRRRYASNFGCFASGYGEKVEACRNLSRRPHPHLGEDFASRFVAGANAVGDADAVITVARQRQPWEVLAARFNTLHAVVVDTT